MIAASWRAGAGRVDAAVVGHARPRADVRLVRREAGEPIIVKSLTTRSM
jgi:hypothetical protein